MRIKSTLEDRFRNSRLRCHAGLTILLCCTIVPFVYGQQVPEGPLTNSSVVKLVKAGFKEKTIIAIIHNRPTQFKLDTEELIRLKHQGISENIILAMLSQEYGFETADDEWGSDSTFFGDSKKNADGTSGSQNPGTGIFGSGGTSRSQSRSRGGNGGSENDGEVTGSATVRIIRPPTEAGGGPTKLERTPTLNNDAIVRLVEAGFSEGTIIKRIEQSPAEFELSPAKLDDLRRRRVTDRIIAAMTAAMGGDETKPGSTPPKPDK